MLLILDPVSTLAQDFRALPPMLAQPLFVEAVRPLRGLTHTPEGAWEAYRDGRCLPGELRAIERALGQRFAMEPEYGRLVSLGLAHTGRPALSIVVLTVSGAGEEAAVLQAFWQMLSKSQKPNLQLVTYGGMRWGLPFLVRRTLLLGLAPSVPLPLGRARLETHFDVDAVLGNWDARRSRPLELAALQYELPGPWSASEDTAGADTAAAIRTAVTAGDREAVRVTAEARLRALVGLHGRLAPSYLGAVA
jgi:Predicted 3'-5' exonuclease related to the exonuclease domain of PolB